MFEQFFVHRSLLEQETGQIWTNVFEVEGRLWCGEDLLSFS